jgi:hypothetical protein
LTLLFNNSTQMVTPWSSPIFLTRLSPSTQLAMASLSAMPRLLPKKVMTFGTRAAAARGISRAKFRSIASWFAFTFRPSGIEPPPA